MMEKDGEQQSSRQLSEDTYYEYEELLSRPFVTPESEIPENLMHQCHSFGYDSGRRANLQLLDDRTLMFIAGNLVIVLDVSTKKQRCLRSCSGGGIGSIAVHPNKKHFAVAEKGNQPNIIVYERPSLRPYRILRGGTERAYNSVAFNSDGSLLASVGNAPDFWLTVWDWRQEQVTLRSKAMSTEVYRVSFSQFKPEQLTTSGYGHIKFWEMADTFTGLKLLGKIGHFGSTPPTDIEGYVELPDGKVMSGSNWGNLLLWSGSSIKMEISRKDGQSCHEGTSQPFAYDDGLVLTFGSDGAIRAWDYNRIDDVKRGNKFSLDAMFELVVEKDIGLRSVVKSSMPDSTLWFAQDSSGAIWKLDLSFRPTAADPQRLFSFHAGPIRGLDVSTTSHLVTTTAADRSVKVYDFLSNRELTSSPFNQGGTVIRWAPLSVDQSEGLLVAGFEDGVVRLLELFNPQKLTGSSRYSHKGEAKLRLKQAFKPHTTAVTAVAYKPDGEILATGGSDSTVFFFTVGEKYNPIGFIHVPGPVQALEWSPYAESENKLLILCQSGHVIEVQSPDPEAQESTKSYQLHGLPSRSFRFRSIKSQIKRDQEIARRQALQEKKEEEDKEEKEGDEENEEEEEEEEELPSIYIPDPPSPICFGFYSHPDQFWLSMGGFDSGFLYHCKFSENQDEDPNQRQDEPFDVLPLHNADDDSILSIAFSSDRKLLFCGMHSGSIRVYPLQPDDHSLTSMQAYWTLSIHDNQNGHLRHVCCSHDDQFVLTAGDDGNIFSFSLIPPEELMQIQKGRKARVPSPRAGLEKEAFAPDIVDPDAHNIEMAKQEQDKEQQLLEAKKKKEEVEKNVLQFRKRFQATLKRNQELPKAFRLTSSELLLDKFWSLYKDEEEKEKEQQLMEVRKQLEEEREERSNIGLTKLEACFGHTSEVNVVSVVGIGTDLRVSTYHVPVLATSSTQHQSDPSRTDGDTAAATQRKKNRPQSIISSDTEDEEILRPSAARPPARQPTQQRKDRILTAEEKADQAQAMIEERKKRWDKLYAEKPVEDKKDPQYIQAIREAKENIGDLKLKSEKDFMLPKQLRMNTEKTTAKLESVQEKIREKQMEMNSRIIALRDSKVHLVSQLQDQTKQLQKIQQSLPPDLHRPPPTLPSMLPEEMPEKKLQFNNETLDRDLREQSDQSSEPTRQLGWGDQRSLMFKQKSLVDEMEEKIIGFNHDLVLLCKEKSALDVELGEADLHRLTLNRELLIHEELKAEEDRLQGELDKIIEEENVVQCPLEECTEELEVLQAEVIKLQDKEKSLTAAFQALLGEENRFAKFLNRVFKMKIKAVKEGEETGSEEDNDEDSEDHNGDSAEEGATVDYSVCPPECDPSVFEKTLKLRERRLDVEQRLAKKKKSVAALSTEWKRLAEKDDMLKNAKKAVEDSIDSLYREKQLRINDVDVVVPLRLNQLESFTKGPVPSNLSGMLVVDRKELSRLDKCSKQSEVKEKQRRQRDSQARQHNAQLAKEVNLKKAENEEMEKRCDQLMMQRFGKIVDMDALLTVKTSKKVEELKRDMSLRNAEHNKELKQLDVEKKEATDAFIEIVKTQTKDVGKLCDLSQQEQVLEDRIKRKQHMLMREFRSSRRHVDQRKIIRLRERLKTQQQQAEAYRTEIGLLALEGVHVSPPRYTPRPAASPPAQPNNARPIR